MSRFRSPLGLLCAAAVFVSVSSGEAAAEEPVEPSVIRAYVGTYTRGESEGIYLFELDPSSGRPTEPRLAAEHVNPSFLAIHPTRKFLYAVGEVSDFGGERGAGGVTAFQIDPATGGLTKLNSQLSGGAGPCHLSVDAEGQAVVVANYGGGSVACLLIEEDGSLKEASTVVQHEGSSVHPRRQTAPHAHSANFDPANRFVMVADLGLDQILVYRFAPLTGSLIPNNPPFVKTPPGGGPRHFVFHPSGRFAYHNNEMIPSITAHQYEPELGVLSPLETVSTLPDDDEGERDSTAEILVHPSGRFLYVSNRGHNSIAIFRIRDDGRVKPAGHQSTQGEIPRNFGIDPTGRFLLAANQNSHTVVIFRIDQETGELTPTGDLVEIPSPVCVRFVAENGD